jgi:phage shock protein PspC (stress-responsive transcriptional regulator)
MIRSLVGYATFAVLGVFAIKVAFKLLGLAVGLFWTLMWLAFVGFVFYLILRLVSPSTADRVQEMIKGKPAA